MTEDTPSWKINALISPKVSFDAVLKLEGMENIQKAQAAYLTDESRYGEGKADAIFFPQNEAEVAAVIREANRQSIPVTIAGARTGLAGGAAPRSGVILSLERMNALLDLHYNEADKKWYLTAQPGVSLEEIRDIVESKKGNQLRSKSPQSIERFLQESADYFYPPDPTEMTAWLGGTVATNASGAASFKYGPTRHWVNRLRVVLANGDILDIKRGAYLASPKRAFQIQWTDGSETEITLPSYSMPLCKNAAGLYIEPHMDLIDLFIGSEGILGVITEIEVILQPKPELMALVIFFSGEKEAIGFVEDIRSSSVDPDLLEYFDPNAVELLRHKQQDNPGSLSVPTFPPEGKAFIFLEIAYTEEALEQIMLTLEEIGNAHGTSMENSWAGTERNEIQKLKILRHAIPETVNAIIAQRKVKYPNVHKLGTDMAVPDEHLRQILQYYRHELVTAGLDFVIFGHVGDNHLHVNILPRNEEELEQGKNIYLKFAEEVVQLKGSVSAEHGIGKLKKDFLRVMLGNQGLREIAKVKLAFDPQGILNPDCMIPIDLLLSKNTSSLPI